MAAILDWVCAVDAIPHDGYRETRTAGSEELRRIAQQLDILSLDALTVDVEIRPSGAGRYRLTGRIEAAATQACVVSLEPVTEELTEDLDVELWDAADIGPLAPGEHSVLEADVPDPIEQGRIDVGRIVYEHLGASLDPYPRHADAQLDATEAGPGGIGDKPPSPFAVLARLKDRGEKA